MRSKKTEVKEKTGEVYTLESLAVTTHLSILAEIVNRLANNSNYCKSAAVVIVSMIAAFGTNFDKNKCIICGIPLLCIALLDSLFVYLKKNVTSQQKTFVEKIEKGKPVAPFNLDHNKKCDVFCGMISNMADVSIWLFYGAMVISLVLNVLLRS